MSLHLSKCHIVGNHMSRLICFNFSIKKRGKTTRTRYDILMYMGESFQDYSKTSKIGTSIFQNTLKLEVNIGHAGFKV